MDVKITENLVAKYFPHELMETKVKQTDERILVCMHLVLRIGKQLNNINGSFTFYYDFFF